MATERVDGWVETVGLEESLVEPGKVRCTLTLGEQHRNIQGVVHGSVTMAVLDTAMGHALDSLLEPTQFCSTTQISFQFLKGVWPGETIAATGEVISRGNRIVYLRGICRNSSEEVVATAMGTWYVGTRRE